MSGTLYATSVFGVVLGLAILLVAEYLHVGDLVVYGGGFVALAAVGLMTLAIAREPHLNDHGDDDHGH